MQYRHFHFLKIVLVFHIIENLYLKQFIYRELFVVVAFCFVFLQGGDFCSFPPQCAQQQVQLVLAELLSARIN